MKQFGDYTHYDVLEVDEVASPDIIDSAYQYLCHKWHPDKHPAQRSEAERRLAELRKAHHVLANPVSRREYDHWLQQQRGLAGSAASSVSKSAADLPASPGGSRAVPAGMPDGYVYAGFWARGGALLVDGLIVALLQLVFGVVWALASGDGDEADGLGINLVFLLVACVYYVQGWCSEKMATPGKAMMGIQVRTEDYQRLGIGRALARMAIWSIGAILLFVTYVFQPFTARRQCLHDMAAGTVVIRREAANTSSVVVVLAVLFGALPVVGILAAISLPAYQDYTSRADAANALLELELASQSVESFVTTYQRVPAHLDETGYRFSGSASASTDVAADVAVGPQIWESGDYWYLWMEVSDGRLTYHPTFGTDGITTWGCYAIDLEPRVLPRGCEVLPTSD